MKKILIFLILAFALVGCGVETPDFTGKQDLFIVGKIRLLRDGNCIYENTTYHNPFSEFIATKSAFKAPKGTFNIGDTVIFKLNTYIECN